MNNNDEKYKKFFYNTENLENVYNILKGDEKQLKKETVKKLIQDFEGVEYDESNDNNLSSKSNNKNSNQNTSNIDDISNNNDSNYDEKNNSSDYISFEEFCSIFKKIYENSRNPEKIFLEGYCYMDKDK
jgi:hypothetical protein